MRRAWILLVLVAFLMAWREEHTAREKADNDLESANETSSLAIAQRDAAHAAALQAQHMLVQLSVANANRAQTETLDAHRRSPFGASIASSCVTRSGFRHEISPGIGRCHNSRATTLQC